MTGILEQISADIRANTEALNRIAAGMAGGAALPQQQYVQQQPVVQQQQPIVQQQPVQQPSVPQNLTGQQLVDLIQPHIGNDAVKAALGEVMRQNGVANLPDAQPHQYGMLYSAFQQVLSRFGIGAPQVQQQPQQTTSII